MRIKVFFLKTYFCSILCSGHSGCSSGTQIKNFMMNSSFSFAQRPINLNKIACFLAKRLFSICLVDTKISVWQHRRKNIFVKLRKLFWSKSQKDEQNCTFFSKIEFFLKVCSGHKKNILITLPKNFSSNPFFAQKYKNQAELFVFQHIDFSAVCLVDTQKSSFDNSVELNSLVFCSKWEIDRNKINYSRKVFPAKKTLWAQRVPFWHSCR